MPLTDRRVENSHSTIFWTKNFWKNLVSYPLSFTFLKNKIELTSIFPYLPIMADTSSIMMNTA